MRASDCRVGKTGSRSCIVVSGAYITKLSDFMTHSSTRHDGCVISRQLQNYRQAGDRQPKVGERAARGAVASRAPLPNVTATRLFWAAAAPHHPNNDPQYMQLTKQDISNVCSFTTISFSDDTYCAAQVYSQSSGALISVPSEIRGTPSRELDCTRCPVFKRSNMRASQA
jgi:hypothetical protein